MLHAQVLVSKDLTLRVEEIKKRLAELGLTSLNPDVLYLSEEQKLGVETIKKIKEFLWIKPLQSEKKVVILENGGNLTPDAQNALLKTLEEPPAESLILIGIENENQLLPTVLSRCQVFPLISTQDQVHDFEKIDQVLKMDLEKRFELIEKTENKEELLIELTYFYHHSLKGNPSAAQEANLVLEALKWKEANGNIRAILEYLMLVLSQK